MQAADMDRVAKTTEIVRTIKGNRECDAEDWRDAGDAKRAAIKALSDSRLAYVRAQIRKMRKAEREHFAPLARYEDYADMYETYAVGLISDERFRELDALWDERLDRISERDYPHDFDADYDTYKDEYTEILDTMLHDLRYHNYGSIEDYHKIEAMWKVEKKPRRTDMRNIRIAIDETHRGEIEDALKAAQNGTTARKIDADDIYKVAGEIKQRSKGVIPRAALAGSRYIVDLNAQSFPKSYTRNYTPTSTIMEITITERQVYLTGLYRGRCHAPSKKVEEYLTDAARAVLDAQGK